MNYFGFPLTNKFRSKTPKGFYDAVKGHTGLDVAMPIGTPLSLPIKGVVLKYRKQTEMGNCLYVQEQNGNIHVLAHLSEAKVREGDQVAENQVLALSGNTGGKSTAPHVHYEIIAPRPEEGLEMMTRELSPYKGWNIDPAKFLDSINTPHWSDESMNWLVNNKIISHARKPDETPSWGELAVILKNLASLVGEDKKTL